MREEGNRGEEGMLAWKAKEKQITDLFSAQVIKTRYFDKLKLDHFRELRRSIRDPTADEKMMRRMLKGEIKRLERRLYPSRLVRLLVKLFSVIGKLLGSVKPIGMLKPYTPIVPESRKQEQKSKLEVSYKKQMQPKLLEKKRQSQKKGLGM